MSEEMRNTSRTYDQLGREYVSPRHQTTEFFYRTQEKSLGGFILSANRHLGIPLDEVHLLNVGGGSHGNSSVMTGALRIRGDLDNRGLNMRNLTYLDISQKALAEFRHNLVGKSLEIGAVEITKQSDAWEKLDPSERRRLFDEMMLIPAEDMLSFAQQHNLLSGIDQALYGGYIVGDAQLMPVASGSQEIVFAALCDGIPDQKAFFSEAMRVLKPRGALITTYPAAELNRFIREQIYHISTDTTRFVIEGKTHIIPSKTLTPEELHEMYQNAGYIAIETKNIMHNRSSNVAPSPTIRTALDRMGKSISEVPILVGGVGFKSAR